MNKVIAVTANHDYSLNLTFNDGAVKNFDVKPYCYQIQTLAKATREG